MELIHDRLLNNQFAPGIATYGIDGKDGKAGPSGTSFYFTSYSLEKKSDSDECVVKINQNKVLSEFVDAQLEREYLVGDLVLDAVGRIYKIIRKNGQFSLDYVSTVVGLDASVMFKTSGNNRLFLDPSYGGLDLIQGTSNNSMTLSYSDANALLRITNTKEDSNSGRFNLFQLQTKPTLGDPKYLNVSFDKLTDAFVVETKSDILVDTSLLEVKSTNSRSTTSLGDYYKITPYDDPIGLVHLMLSDATWSLSNNNTVLTISNIDITHLDALSLSNEFNVKIEQYRDDQDYTGQTVTLIIPRIQITPEDDNHTTGYLEAIITAPDRFDFTQDINISVIRGIEVFIPKS